METSLRSRNVRIQTGLHPTVYALLAGCVLWIVGAVWLAFSANAYTALQIVVVAAFAAVFLGVPLTLARLSAKRPVAGSFREWLDSELDLPDGPVEARKALAMIMSAPLAGALGISLVSLVAWLASVGAI